MGRPGTSAETVGFPAHSVLGDDQLNPMAEGEAADSLNLKGSLLVGQSSSSVKCALPCVASVLPLPRPCWALGARGQGLQAHGLKLPLTWPDSPCPPAVSPCQLLGARAGCLLDLRPSCPLFCHT